MKQQSLTINGEVFDGFRERFDAALTSALRKMKEQDKGD